MPAVDEARVSAVKEQLSEIVSANHLRISDLFGAWDSDQSGTVDKAEFYHALLGSGIDCDRTIANAVFASLDADGSGEVDYRELHEALKPKVEIDEVLQAGAVEFDVEAKNAIDLRRDGPNKEHSMVHVDQADPMQIADLEWRLTAALADNYTRVRDLFMEMDHSGDGQIDQPEFHRALGLLGLTCTRSESDGMFAQWDADGSGSIDYREVHRLLRQGSLVELDEKLQVGAQGEIETEAKNLHALRADGPGCTHSAVVGGEPSFVLDGEKSLQQQLADALNANLSRTKELMIEWDKDGSGTVDLDEFKKALKLLGIEASEDAATELFGQFDKDGGGSIDFRELHRALRPPAPPATEPPAERVLRRRPYRPIVPVRDRLVDLLPRVSPRLSEELTRQYGDENGNIDKKYFVRGLLEAGRRPTSRMGAGLISQRGNPPFAELGMAAKDDKMMGNALNQIFDELHMGGDAEGKVPLHAIPHRLRKLKETSSGKGDAAAEGGGVLPALKGASPRDGPSPRMHIGLKWDSSPFHAVARPPMMEGVSFPQPPHKLPSPRQQPIVSRKEAHAIAADILTEQMRSDRIMEADLRAQHELLLKKQQKQRAANAKKKASPRGLPPINSPRGRASTEGLSQQLHMYQMRGLTLRTMMEKLVTNPNDLTPLAEFTTSPRAQPAGEAFDPTVPKGEGPVGQGWGQAIF